MHLLGTIYDDPSAMIYSCLDFHLPWLARRLHQLQLRVLKAMPVEWISCFQGIYRKPWINRSNVYCLFIVCIFCKWINIYIYYSFIFIYIYIILCLFTFISTFDIFKYEDKLSFEPIRTKSEKRRFGNGIFKVDGPTVLGRITVKSSWATRKYDFDDFNPSTSRKADDKMDDHFCSLILKHPPSPPQIVDLFLLLGGI